MRRFDYIRNHTTPYIVIHEKDHYTPWHHHPEFELVHISKGNGRRLAGDKLAPFEKYDLIFPGPYLPHKWSWDVSDSAQTGVSQN